MTLFNYSKFNKLKLKFIFFFHIRYYWTINTIPKYCLSFILESFTCFFASWKTYSQVGFIVNFYFYVKCFVDDIQTQLRNLDKFTQLELKECFIDVIEFHLKIKT